MWAPSSAAMPPKCTATSSTTSGGAPVTGDVAAFRPLPPFPSCCAMVAKVRADGNPWTPRLTAVAFPSSSIAMTRAALRLR